MLEVVVPKVVTFTELIAWPAFPILPYDKRAPNTLDIIREHNMIEISLRSSLPLPDCNGRREIKGFLRLFFSYNRLDSLFQLNTVQFSPDSFCKRFFDFLHFALENERALTLTERLECESKEGICK